MTRDLPFFFAFTALAATLSLGTARADIIVSVENSKAAQSLTGNFDILLTNTGPNVVSIGAFSFEISTASPNINLTGASTSTTQTRAPYIFEGDSFADSNGLPLATSTGQSLSASDIPNDGVPALIRGSGATVSLGEVSYSIALSAALGPVRVTFSPVQTSLSDGVGNPLDFTAVNGEITITPIPEPTQIPLLVAGLGALSLLYKRRRSR